MVYIIRADDELYHHGILGMHWGKRNGPPYPLDRAGKVKFAENARKAAKLDNARTNKVKAGKTGRKSHDGGVFEQNIKNGKDKPKQSKAQIATKEASKAIDGTRRLTTDVHRIADRANKKTYDTSTMSDSELRNRINRLNMEKQYSQLMTEKESISKGYQRTLDVLDVAGDVAAVAISAATLISIFKSKG